MACGLQGLQVSKRGVWDVNEMPVNDWETFPRPWEETFMRFWGTHSGKFGGIKNLIPEREPRLCKGLNCLQTIESVVVP